MNSFSKMIDKDLKIAGWRYIFWQLRDFTNGRGYKPDGLRNRFHLWMIGESQEYILWRKVFDSVQKKIEDLYGMFSDEARNYLSKLDEATDLPMIPPSPYETSWLFRERTADPERIIKFCEDWHL